MIGRPSPGGAARPNRRARASAGARRGFPWFRRDEPSARSGMAASAATATPAAGRATGRRETGERAPAGTARGARWLLLILVGVGSLQVLFMLGVEGVRLVRAELAISELEAEVGQLEQEAAQLEAVIENGDDERYREQLARRQGYMYPDETRVVTGEPPQP